jgi:EAL domain-containing protein (putative c-di-GMP-specific phosphodiesterase class I)
VDTVDDALAESSLPADALTLELTETALAERDARVHRALAELRRRGVRLALDDFGTGYSNLSYLQRFTPDAIKLDRSFVQALGRSERGDVIAAAVVDVARRLECHVVAEGIETPEQAAAVERLGCTHLQGFLYSPPVFPDELFSAAVPLSRSSA